ncbi:hypothetical protein BH20ACT8_BH20ACT8_17560 [soil metagenome]
MRCEVRPAASKNEKEEAQEPEEDGSGTHGAGYAPGSGGDHLLHRRLFVRPEPVAVKRWARPGSPTPARFPHLVGPA